MLGCLTNYMVDSGTIMHNDLAMVLTKNPMGSLEKQKL